MNDHYQRLEQIYLQAPYNRLLYDDTTIKISAGRAEISTRSVPGIITVPVHCMAQAISGCLMMPHFLLSILPLLTLWFYTVSFTTQFLKPVQSGIITAIGEIKHSTSNLFIGESSLFNDKGQLIALGRVIL